MAELVIRRGLEEPDTSGTFTPHRPPRPDKSMGGRRFELVSEYEPAGDQPQAIAALIAGIEDGLALPRVERRAAAKGAAEAENDGQQGKGTGQ